MHSWFFGAALGVAAWCSGCGGYFRPIPDPVAFSTSDTPPGQGWFCAVRGGNESFCERDILVCARTQSATPGTSACVEWKKPAFCYTYAEDTGKKHIDCHATKEFCTTRSDSWRGPAPSGVDREHVSVCQEVP